MSRKIYSWKESDSNLSKSKKLSDLKYNLNVLTERFLLFCFCKLENSKVWNANAYGYQKMFLFCSLKNLTLINKCTTTICLQHKKKTWS